MRSSIANDSPGVDHLGRARQLSSEGDVKGALLEARRALFTTPSDVETLSTVAKLSRRAGQPELAAEAWGRVAALTTDDALPLIQQARALIQLKDYAGAVMAGRDAIARDSGNVEAFQVTGIAQLAMNELGGAIASFEKAVELEPNHGWALNNLGFACLRANQNERAVDRARARRRAAAQRRLRAEQPRRGPRAGGPRRRGEGRLPAGDGPLAEVREGAHQRRPGREGAGPPRRSRRSTRP